MKKAHFGTPPRQIQPRVSPLYRHTAQFFLNTYADIDMSGRRPLIKGYFAALRLIVGAVMFSAC